MSASEKLRALMGDERWKSHDSTVLAGLALEFYGTSGHGALPQIVAVVEAAQGVHYWLWERDAHWTDNAESITATEDAVQVLDAALAALDEALT